MDNNIYKRLLEKSFKFLKLNDYDLILDNILLEVKDFLNAEAGTIYIAEDNFLVFQFTKNDVLKLESSEIRFSKIKLPIDNTSIAGYVANNKQTLNIKDVYELDSSLPYSFNNKVDKQTGYRTKSMLTIPITDSMGNILGVMQIINKVDSSTNKVVPFSEIDEKLIANYFALQAGLALERAILTRGTILKMIAMAEMRDPKETGAHVKRVSNYSSILYRKWLELKGLNDEAHIREIDKLKLGAMLHDVGKIGIPDTILKKPGKLTDEEFKIIKMHTIYGAKLFDPIRTVIDKTARDIALNHHEKWDGTGYPGFIDDYNSCSPENLCKKPKKGEEIPILGRIVAVADVLDALLSKRVYKPAWTMEDAFKEINRCSGKHFDPDIVYALNLTKDKIEKVYKYYQD